MLESAIEKRLKKAIEKRGGLCLKFTSPGCSGVPDRIIVLPDGRLYFVELKQKSKRLEPLQQRWKQRLEVRGQKVYRVDDVEEFINAIYPA